MIKNIVFDMGKVLVDYDENKCIDLYVKDEADRDLEKLRTQLKELASERNA